MTADAGVTAAGARAGVTAARRVAGSGIALRTALASALLVTALAACGAADPVATTVAPFDPRDVASPVDGQVIKLDTEGLTKVRGVVLRTDEGAEIPFEVGPLENAVEFPPSHLAEHMATGEAVRVSFRVEGETLVVYRVEDAPAP